MKTFPCFQCFSAFYIHIQKLGGNTSPQPFLISPNGRACRATAYRHWRATRYYFSVPFFASLFCVILLFCKRDIQQSNANVLFVSEFFLIVHFQYCLLYSYFRKLVSVPLKNLPSEMKYAPHSTNFLLTWLSRSPTI